MSVLSRCDTLLLGGGCSISLKFPTRNRLPIGASNRHNFSAIIQCHRPKRGSLRNARLRATEEGKDLQSALWIMEGIYVIWLFVLPYAPGDPVWAISAETIDSLIGLSLNFFFVLPLLNSVGVAPIHSPVLHPASEGLFNFVIGWTLMFGPLLFSDRKRGRFQGSLDLLWGAQMFLTNAFLIPYMAIRQKGNESGRSFSNLQALMTKGADVVGWVGGAVCVVSVLWVFFGRGDGGFGGFGERWDYLVGYVGSERLAYAFVWDICLYSVFQPWLIGDNLLNVERSKIDFVRRARFVPVFGLVAYLLCLDFQPEK